MVKLITYTAILFCAFTLFNFPYVAALFYSFVSLLQPQYIWHWVFDGLPIFKITAGMAILAWSILILRGRVNKEIYRSGIVFSLLFLLIIFYTSNALTPFKVYFTGVSSDIVMSTFTTIVMMFIVIVGCIKNENEFRYLVLIFLLVVLYYTYWANSAYFSSEWFKFSLGRLEGPGGSPYRDGNVASVMFVIAVPFFVLALYEFKKLWSRIAIVVVLIFILHAIILFASRGALVSIAVSLLVLSFVIKSKLFNMFLAFGLVFFLVDQGGQLVSRSTVTIQTAQQDTAEPLNPRLVSWQVGLELVKKHPILGVGPQRFQQASRNYFPGKSPHVAHNTFLNFAANTGLISGFLYLSFFWLAHKNYRKNLTIFKKHPNQFLNYVNQASYAAMAGFFTAAIFLDLIIYEPFYFLLAIVVLTHHLTKKHGVQNATRS